MIKHPREMQRKEKKENEGEKIQHNIVRHKAEVTEQSKDCWAMTGNSQDRKQRELINLDTLFFSNAIVCPRNSSRDMLVRGEEHLKNIKLGDRKMNAMQENQTRPDENELTHHLSDTTQGASQSRSQARRFSSFLARRFSLNALSSFLVGFLFDRSAFKLRPP